MTIVITDGGLWLIGICFCVACYAAVLIAD